MSFLVFASQGMTEAKAGSNMTLRCILHSADWCKTEAKSYEVYLRFLDEQGNELMSNKIDSRRCSITYTVSVQLIDPNTNTSQRTWRCQLMTEKDVQTSISLITRVKGQCIWHTLLVFIQMIEKDFMIPVILIHSVCWQTLYIFAWILCCKSYYIYSSYVY